MRRRHALKIAFAALLGVLAVLALPALAGAKDRNHDRIPDRWEKRHHLSLQVNQAHRDQDRDGLDNRGEFRAGDNPRDDDSDEDGVMDGDENAGTISAFDAPTGRLTIALFAGGSATGTVASSTEIRCEGAEDSGAPASRDRGGSEPGDDNGGRGEAEPGDDHGGEGQGANATCGTAELKAGAVVHEADLEVEHGVATFDEIELAQAS
jgi:hypothetical protein